MSIDLLDVSVSFPLILGSPKFALGFKDRGLGPLK